MKNEKEHREISKITGKEKKSYKVKGTMRQRLAMSKLMENRGVLGKSMEQAGYPKVTAKNPKNLTESKAFKQALPDLIDRLGTEIDRAVSLMPKKIKKAKYRDLVEGTDKLIKNRQLLKGGSTIIGDLTIKWDE